MKVFGLLQWHLMCSVWMRSVYVLNSQYFPTFHWCWLSELICSAVAVSCQGCFWNSRDEASKLKMFFGCDIYIAYYQLLHLSLIFYIYAEIGVMNFSYIKHEVIPVLIFALVSTFLWLMRVVCSFCWIPARLLSEMRRVSKSVSYTLCACVS